MNNFRTRAAAGVFLASLLMPVPGAGAAVTVPALDLPIGSSPLEAVAALPEVRVDEVEVLGPSTARVYATVEPNGLDTTVQVHYGISHVLNMKSTEVEVGATLEPVRIVEDLVNLRPATGYDLFLSAATPLGSSTSARASFFTGHAVTVSPLTGHAAGAAAKKKTRCTIVGTAKRDRISGTKSRDVICGLGGNDVIRSRGGNDLVLGGKGRDRMIAAAGRDVLRGNSGNDRLSGGSGNDRLFGDSGRDQLAGGRGRDRLRGGKGRDRARGVTKSDRVAQVEVGSRRVKQSGFRR
jgi:Ca2+-binding RTX toxin-like protein